MSTDKRTCVSFDSDSESDTSLSHSQALLSPTHRIFSPTPQVHSPLSVGGTFPDETEEDGFLVYHSEVCMSK